MIPVTAILLIGHSHSGKTPLGQRIEQHASLGPTRFMHLDFGEQLRAIAASRKIEGLAARDRAFVQSILDGTLLESPHFYIARAIIENFMKQRCLSPCSDMLVLNGFPRTCEQADFIKSCAIDVSCLVHCACSAEDAAKRKEMADRGFGHENRSHRNDNDKETFRRKIESFEKRTRPLLQYYGRENVPVHELQVHSMTTPGEMLDMAKAALEILIAQRNTA